MKERTLRAVSFSLLAVGLVSFVFYLASGLSRSRSLMEIDAFFIVAFGMFLPLGVFIIVRRPRNSIGWIMCGIGLSSLLGNAAIEYSTRALIVDPGSLPAGREVAFFSELVGVPGLALLSFLMLLFPTGRSLSPRWRWVARIAGANMAVIIVALGTLWPLRGPQLLRDDVPQDLLIPEVVFEISWIVLMTTAVAGLVSLVVRFRRSSGVERQQLKWMAYVAAIVGSLVVFNFFILDPLAVEDPTLPTVAEQALNVAVAGIPIAAAIAISRYRLYDIDVVINRTLVYGGLTAVLAGMYVGLVFVFQLALSGLTEESDLAVAASTLAVAALFRPVRIRIQTFIDRRFYRSKFDAQHTLEDFSGTLRDEVDLKALTSQLVGVVSETMQPAHVSLWIRGPVSTGAVTISER